jgi:hypothetical protein
VATVLVVVILVMMAVAANAGVLYPGVFRVTPDPAEVFAGGTIRADVDIDDGGQPSCLFGTVPNSGFTNPFEPPKFSPPHQTTWRQTVDLTVASSVAPGNYEVNVWAQAQYSNGQTDCSGGPIGPTYIWDIVVKPQAATLPGSRPSPTGGAAAGPTPSLSASASPTPTPVLSPTSEPSPLALPDLASGETEKSMTTNKSSGLQTNNSFRSSFVLAVDSAQGSWFDPKKLAVSLGIAALLTLLIAFPGELFAKTWQENTLRIRNAFGFLKRRRAGIMRRLSRSWLGFVLVLPLTALLYGVLSRDFGINTQTLVLIVGMLGSLAIIIGANELTAALYLRRRKDRVYLRVFPGTLAIAITCVAVSRLVGFEPGYLYGLVAGAAFRGSVDDKTQGKAVAIASISLLTISIAAWVGWLFVEPAAARTSAPIGLLVLEAMLVATFVAGLEALLFGLLPMTFLDGQKLRNWNRLVWAVLFGITTFLFVHLVLNPETSYIGFSRDTPTLVVLALFLGFGLFSVGFWAWFRFVPARNGATSN